jgi:Uma2 family endonuclease
MSATVKVSPAEYLELERKAEFKSEYLDGIIRRRPDSNRHHCLIATNFLSECWQQLRATNAEVYSSNMRIRAENSYFYPDMSVVCQTPVFEDAETDVLLNPTLLLEIVSPETEFFDRNEKFVVYRQMESLEEYVLVSQLMPRVEIFKRQGNDWLFSKANGLEVTVRLESIGCELKLSEVYEKVKFPQSE